MRTNFALFWVLILTFNAPTSMAGVSEATLLGGSDRLLICEENLSDTTSKEAIKELNQQIFGRPFTIFYQYEDRTKFAFQEFGMAWLKESEIDHLILKVWLDAAGAHVVAGLEAADKWLKVLSTDFIPDNPLLWRGILVKQEEMNLSLPEVTLRHPKSKYSFLRQIPETIGFKSATSSTGVRRFLAISDSPEFFVDVTLGIDVPCSDVLKFMVDTDEDRPVILKTPNEDLCRIPILSFQRNRIYK